MLARKKTKSLKTLRMPKRTKAAAYHLVQLRFNEDIYEDLAYIAEETGISTATGVARHAIYEFIDQYFSKGTTNGKKGTRG